MKILFVSKLEGYDWKGPSHSVPMQIKHQAQVDDVLWLNLTVSINKDWKNYNYYIESENAMKTELKDVPDSFQKPDLIVFEGIYEYPFFRMMREIWKNKIPYVVVPRSALTKDAQLKKPLKKIVGNILFFNKFVRRAAAVHYLTDAEQEDSKKWKTKSFVVPNGIMPVARTKTIFSNSEKLVLSYVGRIEKYQKGLDLLIDACAKIADLLKENNVSVHLYGPDREGSFEDLSAEIKKNGLSDIVFLHDGVFGEEKERVLLESDAFIMTSRFEGLPMGMIEALAYGVPVLATKGTNLTDEIAETNSGWVSDNSVDGIVNMLEKAIAERDKYREKSEQALELSRRYNWQSIAIKAHEEYLKLIGKTN